MNASSTVTTRAGERAPSAPTLIAASTSIWRKHVGKFLGNAEELFGVIVQPVLWVVLFGVGMRSAVAVGAGDDYVGFMLPGIVALSAMGGAIGGGMVWLDERVRGIVREYLVAPVPRLGILLGNAGSTLTKSLLQALVIFAVGILMGAAVTGDVLGGSGDLPLLLCVAVTSAFAVLGLAAASRAFATKTRRG